MNFLKVVCQNMSKVVCVCETVVCERLFVTKLSGERLCVCDKVRVKESVRQRCVRRSCACKRARVNVVGDKTPH